MAAEGDILWTPSPDLVARHALTRFRRWINEARGLDLGDYPALWRWSVDHLEEFWGAVWEYFDLRSPTGYRAVLGEQGMPGAEWFPGAELNFTREVLARARPTGPILLHRSETRPGGALTRDDLAREVARAAAALRRAGVRPGDRVAGFLPSIPETVVALLATSAVGAIWACCSPDFGSQTVLDRFQQLEPKVLIALDGYRFGGKAIERLADVDRIAAGLPSVETVVLVPYLSTAPALPSGRPATLWERFLGPDSPPLECAPTRFGDPLWVVFTSGTTGLPKGIAHGHGGIVLESLKLMCLHSDLTAESVFFFYTSSGWINFNILVTGLLTGATIAIYDGNPVHPAPDLLWKLCDEFGATSFGVSPAFIQLLSKAGVRPKDVARLDRLESITCTGSTVTPEHFEWVYHNVKADVAMASSSGGTEIATGFFVGTRLLPVRAGEMAIPCLGVAVECWNDDGKPVVGEVGELVVTRPMPSMPLCFWNDPGNIRYLATYFEPWPGVWRHGDLLKITDRGSGVIYGRSDSTLNRHGVRIGTSDVYRIVEGTPGVRDSLVVNVDRRDGDSTMILFLVQADGSPTLDPALEALVKARLGREGSPRHVPDEIVAMPAIPYTLTGKKMEVPVKKLLQGVAPEKACSKDAMAAPAAIDGYLALAREWAGR
ncbi:MAG: acetoacetate--CoA ligase [Gemmatimonadetes bacterium]|nr:acetoacetate--CoA ligase [Gemmatimonadota bacterium]